MGCVFRDLRSRPVKRIALAFQTGLNPFQLIRSRSPAFRAPLEHPATGIGVHLVRLAKVVRRPIPAAFGGVALLQMRAGRALDRLFWNLPRSSRPRGIIVKGRVHHDNYLPTSGSAKSPSH